MTVNPAQFEDARWRPVVHPWSMSIGAETVHKVNNIPLGDYHGTEVTGFVTKTPSGRYGAHAERNSYGGSQDGEVSAPRDYRTAYRAQVAGDHLINQQLSQ